MVQRKRQYEKVKRKDTKEEEDLFDSYQLATLGPIHQKKTVLGAVGAIKISPV